MSPDQVAALLTLLADLQLRVSQLEHENAAMRRVMAEQPAPT